jgi:hypothetical protein
MQEGIVGRSYRYENIGDPEGECCVGRVYYVWRKTTETADRDREIEKLDREWALRTGGLLGYDAAVRALDPQGKRPRG